MQLLAIAKRLARARPGKQQHVLPGEQQNDLDLEALRKKFNRRLRRISERTILGLSPKQVYTPRAFLEPELLLPNRCPLFNRETPIASMGSCFAREIKTHLEAKGFHYVSRGEGPALRHGSAPWERVYNTACMVQEIDRAFGRFQPDLVDLPDGRVIDPHRKSVVFGSRDEAERRCCADAEAARAALTDASVFILTLGLSEIWYDKVTGKAFAAPLPEAAFDSDRHALRLLSPDENAANLDAAIRRLREHNHSVEIILTVSPIPLRATFFDRSVITSNSVSKASLLYSAHEITQAYPFVHYFPSYEIVFNLFDDPFVWDARHVKPEVVGKIMEMFEVVYLRP